MKAIKVIKSLINPQNNSLQNQVQNIIFQNKQVIVN